MLNIYFVTKTILSIKNKMGTSLMTQWLRICLTKKKKNLPYNAGDESYIPEWGTNTPHSMERRHPAMKDPA